MNKYISSLPLVLRQCTIILMAVLFVVSFADNSFCDEKPVTYSNEDIEKYHHPSDNRPVQQTKTTPSAKKDESKRSRDTKDQDYWCKQATIAKNKIEHAEREVRERKEDLLLEQSRRDRSSGKISTLQRRLTKANNELSSAERNLSDIEHEAHRKGIRPGWLRCQFD